MLYDITSSYFEGEYTNSELVQFGYNRDGKRGHQQVVIGLLTSAEGCPVAVEVFPCNCFAPPHGAHPSGAACRLATSSLGSQDASTVEGKVKELQEQYGIKELVFVGDRGMITASNEAKLSALPEPEGIKIISALTYLEIVDLLARTNYAAELFDDRNIVEITDPGTPEHRYCLCRNPHSALRETTTRNELLERTRKELDLIAGRKKPALEAVIGARVGQILAKTKMGKYLHWSVQEGRLIWSVDEAAVEAAQALDGCYVIKTTVRADAMNNAQVVARYISLPKLQER